MPRRVTNRLKFLLERLILRGAHFRLLVIAAVIGLVSLLAGVLVFALGAFAGPGEAVWWAFLRLTDPGYLGDDQGVLLRTVSTVLTVAGFVLFVGALIAILTQWLNQTIRDLESGFTPVALRNHIVILGWTNRTAVMVRELVLAEGRVKRFLRRHGARGLRIAILAETVGAPLMQELRDRLGHLWNARQTVLRSGSPLRLEHLRRVDFMNAAAILLPASDFQHGGATADTRVVKTLLSMGNHPVADGGRPPPLVVAEIFDARKLQVARRAYPGRVELLASDSIISRLIAQNVRHRGLSQVYGELLTYGRGNQIYVRSHPRFAGSPLHDLQAAFPAAVLLGVARPHGASFSSILNPPREFRLEADDRLVLLARRYEETEPAGAPAPSARGERHEPSAATPLSRRVLLLGWSHRVPALLREFDSYGSEAFQIDVMSTLAPAERDLHVDRYGVRPTRIQLRQLHGDYTSPADLGRTDPGSYDNVVLLGSDRLESGEESDARTILGYHLLRDLVRADGGPAVLVELLDPENFPLFRRRSGEVLISPLVLSHMLVQVALRPELRAIFDQLFGPGGPEFSFAPPARYGATGADVTFRDLQQRVASRGDVALGVRREPGEGEPRGRVLLNPPRGQKLDLGPGDQVVVLTTV